MNLDLLKKLVKLANNNPNENEANAAARKACKIIEEGKFQFHPSNPNQSKTINDLNEILKRTNTPQHKQEPFGTWYGFKEPPRYRPEYKSVYQSTCSKCGKLFQHNVAIPQYISPICVNCYSPFTKVTNCSECDSVIERDNTVLYQLCNVCKQKRANFIPFVDWDFSK